MISVIIFSKGSLYCKGTCAEPSSQNETVLRCEWKQYKSVKRPTLILILFLS